MATLVLGAVGYALGGPVGGAIGSLLGQPADAAIFAPKGRQGPRLGELAVQTSSYGAAIPKIFGTMRVAGTVIWATDLREERSTGGGGKGRPQVTSYAYSASFAVALSGRKVSAVRRIWADGKLLRGAAGDFKSATGYRFHDGDEEQLPDPLIAAAEGAGRTPAFRGLAYVVFEDFELADYGNRIPSLSFEVEADAGAVAIGAIAAALSGGAVADGGAARVQGYAASGDSVRAAIEPLSDIAPLSLADDGERLRLGPAMASDVVLDARDAGAARDGRAAGARTNIVRVAAGMVADEVSIAYYDVGRDYQTGMQRAALAGPGLRADRRTLAAALDASAAKTFAEQRLEALWAARTRATLRLSWRRGAIRPGQAVRIAGESGSWIVKRWTFERMVVGLELERAAAAAGATDAGASAGRPVTEADLPHGPTVLRLLDLPLAGELAADRPQLLAAAAGTAAGWRRAALSASFDQGMSWRPAGATAAPAVMGSALTALPPGGAALFDDAGSVEIVLLNDAMWLEGRDDLALADGANLAALGDELIQFGVAEPLGGGRFRLRRLLRGRRGSEWAAAGHQAGESFVLLESASLALIEPPAAARGGEARVMATGIGDATAVEARVAIVGEALRPPSPAHLRAERRPDGDIVITWVRRSRGGWAWLDGGDAPLGEETEAYRLLLSGGARERVATVAAPGFVYTAAAQAADGATGTIAVELVQLGTHAASRPVSTRAE